MRAFAQWLTGRRHRAIFAVAGLGLIPPLAVLSGGIITLVGLHRDLLQGLTVALAATGVLLAVSLLGGSGAAGLLYTAMWWPALGLALLLRRHGSLSLCFQASAIGGGILLVGIYLIVEDPAAGWRPILESLVPLLRDAGLTPAGDTGEIVALIAAWMTGNMVGGLTLSVLLSLFLGRWLQLMVTGAGGFGAEFQQLRLGLVLVATATLVLVGALVTRAEVLDNLLLVFVYLLLLQGTAVIHRLAAEGAWHRGWLVALYVLLLFPSALQFLAGLGLTVLGYLDNWKRFGARNSNAN